MIDTHVGDNNTADGTPVVLPSNDPTHLDLMKNPLHNPGIIVAPGSPDPSPATN